MTPTRKMESLETPETSEFKALIDKYSPFIVEIKKRALFTLLVFVVVLVVGFIYSGKIIGLVVEIFAIKGVNIILTSPFQFINISLSISFMLGLAILFPFLIFQIISFLKPALKKNEFNLVLWLLPFSILLFIVGFIFGIMIMRYIVLASYIQSTSLNIGNYLDISNLLSQMLTTASIMGVTFEFPIVITALMRLGIIKHETFAKKRTWVYAIAALFAGLVPPADIPSTVIYFLVIIGLFELTLVLNRVFETKKNILLERRNLEIKRRILI